MIYFLKKNEKALNEEKDQQSNTFVNCMNGCFFFLKNTNILRHILTKMVKNLRSEKKNWFNVL